LDNGQALEYPKIYYLGYKAYTPLNSAGEKQWLGVKESPNGLVEVYIPQNSTLQNFEPPKIHLYFGWSKATELGVTITLITIIVLAGCVVPIKVW
jgi:hypothetical protein